MSSGVRRLWTAAIALLTGCQSAPSLMTSPFVAAPLAAWIVPDESSESFPAPTGPQAGSSERPPAAADERPAGSEALGWSAMSVADEVSRPPSADQIPQTDARTGTSAVSGEAPTTTKNWASAPGDEHVSETAPQPTSFADFRHRLLGREPAATTAAGEATHAAATEVGEARGDFSEHGAPPIVQTGHDESTGGSRSFLRTRDRSLEAPTPYSAISRETSVAESARRETPEEPVAETAGDAGPTQEGFVGSLFDVFGIGGERVAASRDRSSSTLRPAGIGRIERPSGDRQHVSSANEDTLRKSLQTVHWQEELDRLTALLETQLAHQMPGESPVAQDYYVRQHVALRLLYLIGSRRPEALQAIPHCDPSQQEFWVEMLWALSSIFDDEAMPDQARRARETAARLRAALTHIAPQAGLHLNQAIFCRQINGYGSYVTFDRDEFSPGQSVLVYAEVENFTSELTPEGDFRTTLESMLRIQRDGPTGPIVFEEQLPPSEDRCRSRRQDYFHSYRITLPVNLAPGPHVLTLTVRDRATQKLGTASINFLIR